MKNSKAGSVGVIVLIVVAAVALALAYYYFTPKSPAVTPEVISPVATTISDTDFIEASDDPEGKVLARGDINGDGYEDALVQELHCGASCGVNLAVIFSDKDGKLTTLSSEYSTFEPAFVGSSAAKSDVKEVSIKDGVISLTGNGLACTPPGSEEPCTEDKWNVERTVTYKFNGTKIVQIETKTGEFGY